MKTIYLDHHATTPLAPEALEAMMPYLTSEFGNPSSIHPFGWAAKEAVETARKQVARLIGGDARDIIFTSGATESNNLVLYGILEQQNSPGPHHFISSKIEHKSILEPLKDLIKKGHNVTFLEPDSYGIISSQNILRAIRHDTILVTLQAANNEVGTIQNISEIGRICRDHRIYFHTDAVQYLPYLPLNVDKSFIDLLSMSGHKMNGPKGIGALYVRSLNPRVRLSPHTFGSGQERGLRSGTLNVPGIVGLGVACQLVLERREAEAKRIANLRDHLEDRMTKLGAQLNGPKENRLPQNLSISFDGIKSSDILKHAKQLAVSQGAACNTGQNISHVLTAMGVSEKLALGTLRFGLGHGTTQGDIDQAVSLIENAIQELRKETL